jgi:hypothetical protein
MEGRNPAWLFEQRRNSRDDSKDRAAAFSKPTNFFSHIT